MTTDRSSEHARLQLESAEKALSAAQYLLEGNQFEAAANRAYYAMFHAAQGALATTDAGMPRSHRGTEMLFGDHFIRTGRIEERFVKMLRQSSDLRMDSDYDVYAPIDDQQVSEMVQNAEAFVVEMKRLLEEQGSW